MTAQLYISVLTSVSAVVDFATAMPIQNLGIHGLVFKKAILISSSTFV